MLSYSNTHGFKILVCLMLPVFSILMVLPDGPLHANVKYNKEVIVGPGDAIRIMVWDRNQIEKQGTYLSNFNREFVIDGRGFIRLLTLGDVQIGGNNAEKIAEILTEKFRLFTREPIVVVIPLIRLTLYGAFRRPGTYRVAPDITFWQLVDEAGGPTNNCDFEKIRVERKAEIVIQNFLAAFEEAHSLQDVGIQSGDQIFAPAKNRISFRDLVSYFNFGASLIMLYLSFQNYRARRQ
jgi:protein involved in polysaccharide export with SLBB domain